MKRKFTAAIVGILCLFALAGCVHFPSTSTARTVPPAGVLNAGKPTTGPLVNRKPLTQSQAAVQEAANTVAKWFWMAGACALLAAGGLFYLGQVVPAVKLTVAGVLLPIFGTWFAWHWLAVVIAALVGGAMFFWATHRALLSPLLGTIEAEGEKLRDKLVRVI